MTTNRDLKRHKAKKICSEMKTRKVARNRKPARKIDDVYARCFRKTTMIELEGNNREKRQKKKFSPKLDPISYGKRMR